MEKIIIKAGNIDDSLSIFRDKELKNIFFSMNAYVASVLRTGRIIANNSGITEIYIGRQKVIQVEVIESDKKRYPLLVSRNNGLDPYYKPDNLLKKESGKRLWNPEKELYVEQECAKAYEAMAMDAKQDKIFMRITNAFRSYSDQEVMLNKYIKNKGIIEANKIVAPPGFSEHQLGEALDVAGAISETGENISTNQEVWQWIADNAYKYGFMIKNVKGKERIHGGIYEPWHIRFINDVDVAEYIHKREITLNEYLEKVEER